MVFLFKFLLVVSLFKASAQGLPTPLPLQKMTGENVYEKNKGIVFRLSTKLINGKDKSSHGTAFVVSKQDGILLTNYHVIADSLLNPDKYQTVIELGTSETPANVLLVDPVNDLALVHVQQQFSDEVTIANAPPTSPGQLLFSMGFPKSERLSIIQGNLNGSYLRGFSKVTATSMPLNPGMSGGPCFNDIGHVIGVNRATNTQAQNISYLSPLSAIQSIIRRAHIQGTHKFNLQIRASREQIVKHIISYENFKIRTPSQQNKEHQVDRFKFAFPLSNLNCGQDSDGKSKIEHFLCSNESFSLITPNINALSFETYVTVNTNNVFTMNANDIIEKKMNAIEHNFDAIKDRSIATVKPSTPGIPKKYCNAHRIINKNKVELVSRICSIAVPQFPGLYATFVKTDVVSKDKKLINFAQSFEGMSLKKTSEILNYFWNSIHED